MQMQQGMMTTMRAVILYLSFTKYCRSTAVLILRARSTLFSLHGSKLVLPPFVAKCYMRLISTLVQQASSLESGVVHDRFLFSSLLKSSAIVSIFDLYY
jgi:hypothetical protein